MSTLLQSWLFAWLFAFGIAVGSLALLMVHALTGGSWGEGPRIAWRAAARLLPALALLFVPVLVGMRLVYPWVETPGRWLDPAPFVARALCCFAAWIALAHFFLRAEARAHDRGQGVETARRIGAGGLVLHALLATLAAYDWIASLAPAWHSSGFGLVVAVGQMLAGMAFGIAAAAFGPSPAERVLLDTTEEGRRLFHDLGNFLLMFVLTWAYLAYTEFLIIWAADQPKEIAWYVPRLQTSWAALGVFLAAFHFFVPFAILLSRAAKRSRRFLGTLAAALLAAHAAQVFWLVMPSLRREGASLALTDFVALAVMTLAAGALWQRLRAAESMPRAQELARG
jgi:hypothetical protein